MSSLGMSGDRKTSNRASIEVAKQREVTRRKGFLVSVAAEEERKAEGFWPSGGLVAWKRGFLE